MKVLTVVLTIVLLSVCCSSQTWSKIEKTNGKLGSFLNCQNGQIQSYKNANGSIEVRFCNSIQANLRKCINLSFQAFGQISQGELANWNNGNIKANLQIQFVNKTNTETQFNYSLDLTGSIMLKNLSYLILSSEGDDLIFYLAENHPQQYVSDVFKRQSKALRVNAPKTEDNSKPGRFSNNYSEADQVSLCLTSFNLYVIIIYVCSFMIQNDKQNEFIIKGNLSKTADVIVLLTNSIIYNTYQSYIFTEINVIMMLVVYSLIFKFFTVGFYLTERLAYFNKKQKKGQIPRNAMVYLLFYFLPYQIWVIIIVFFIIDDIKILIQEEKINAAYREIIHYQLLTILFIPVLKLFFGCAEGSFFETVSWMYVWPFFVVWIIMASLFEISYQFGFMFAFRRFKWFFMKQMTDILPNSLKNIDKLKEKTCRICYGELQQRYIIGTNCQHRFHTSCIKSSKANKCPIDETIL